MGSVDEETIIEQAEVSPKNPKKNKGSPEKSEEIRESSEERRGRRTKLKPRKKSTDPAGKDTSPAKSDKKQTAPTEMEVAEDVDQIMAFLKQTEPKNAKTNEEKKENSNENGKEKGKSEDLVSTQKGGRGRRGRKKKIKNPPTKTLNPQKEVKSKPS